MTVESLLPYARLQIFWVNLYIIQVKMSRQKKRWKEDLSDIMNLTIIRLMNC